MRRRTNRWVASQFSLTANLNQLQPRSARLARFGEGKKIRLRGSINGPPNNSLRESEMKYRGAQGLVFIVLGVVFIAMGSSGRRAFLVVGAALAVIGLASLVRQRRGRSA